MNRKKIESIDELIESVEILENEELWASRVIDESQAMCNEDDCSETSDED